MPPVHHQRFDGADTVAEGHSALEIHHDGGKTRPSSSDGLHADNEHAQSSDDDDDDAPEAIQASSAKSRERERLSKLQSLQSTAKQAKRKRDVAVKSQSKKQKQPTADRKGKGRAADVEEAACEADEDVTEDVQESGQSIAPSTRTRHQVFGSDDEQEASTSVAPRLDPALFQQADLALSQAKERAIQEERAQRQERARVEIAAAESEDSSYKRGRGQPKATRVIGDTTIQQLAPDSQASIDSTTALTSKRNEKFLNDRLFKRKRARLTTKTSDKNKAKDEDKPFLIFDPLLDKPKKKQEAKPLTRSEMEERMRFRKSAQTTFSKSQRRTMGPSVAFGLSSGGRKGRSFQKGTAI